MIRFGSGNRGESVLASLGFKPWNFKWKLMCWGWSLREGSSLGRGVWTVPCLWVIPAGTGRRVCLVLLWSLAAHACSTDLGFPLWDLVFCSTASARYPLLVHGRVSRICISQVA